MTVVISVDMEGVCGVSSWIQVSPPEYGGLVNPVEYERARLRMTREANAAALGAFDAGADGVIVADSHDGMKNLVGEELDPRVRYVSGSDRPLSMVQGVDEPGVRGLLFVGYHARAGSPRGPLAHTWDGHVHDVRINGRSTGEYGLNALLAAHFGVPVIFASGDDVAMQQIRDELGPQVKTVAVKQGLSTYSAIHLHPQVAQDRIRAGAAEAVRSLDAATPHRTTFPAACELEFEHVARADQCERVPGVTRVNATSVGWTSADAMHLFATFRLLARVGDIRLNG
jgi:D-amino peptidase